MCSRMCLVVQNYIKKLLCSNCFLKGKLNQTVSWLSLLQSYESQLRLATVWTIINLISPSSPGSLDRHVKLRSAGIILQLKSMVNDPCLDVKIRIIGQSVSFVPDTLSIQQVKAVRKGWIVVPHSRYRSTTFFLLYVFALKRTSIVFFLDT
ncbi:unnamed protein product [Brassica napus]|uniref:(rape) hypothetical protein n=1 Tax=Brassica napus TaxID=3708 RepID=A0A816IQM8_BRANA|nr:unnamed protein product [Brassica napus]